MSHHVYLPIIAPSAPVAPAQGGDPAPLPHLGLLLGAASGAYSITADGATFALSGGDVGLLYGRNLTADGGSFALTGQDVTLVYGRSIIADGGSFSLTGQDASLVSARLVVADGGSFAYSSLDASLIYGNSLTADGGTFSYSGQDVTLLFGRSIAADGATYSLTLQDASLIYVSSADGPMPLPHLSLLGGASPVAATAYTLTAEGGVYNYSGEDALRDMSMVAEGATYALTGQDVTLTYSPAGAYSLTADGGSFSLTGQDASLLFGRTLTADGGTYSLSGSDAGLLLGRTVAADGGSYAITGGDSGLLFGRAIQADGSTYALTGADVTLTYDASAYVIAAEGALFNCSFDDASLIYSGEPQGGIHDVDFEPKLWWQRREKDTPQTEPRQIIRLPKRSTGDAIAEAKRIIAQAATEQVSRGAVPTKSARFAEIRRLIKPFGKQATQFNWPDYYTRLYQKALDDAILAELMIEDALQAEIMLENDALALLLAEA